jgi:hypothetical protein
MTRAMMVFRAIGHEPVRNAAHSGIHFNTLLYVAMPLCSALFAVPQWLSR